MFNCYIFLHVRNLFVLILQGYDSIPAEIPDPKAKKVYCLLHIYNLKKLINMYLNSKSKISIR